MKDWKIDALTIGFVILWSVITISACELLCPSEAEAAPAQETPTPALAAPTETDPPEPEYDDAALIAKAWYGFGRYYSDEVLESYVDFVDNRVQAQLYGAETVAEVILRPQQWQGWSDDNPVLQSVYDKIKDIMADRAAGGYRTIPKDCLYFNCETNGIRYYTELGSGNSWYIGN